MSVTRDEWLAALGEATAAPEPNALTTPELASILGLSARAALTRVRTLIAQGKARQTYTIRPYLNGQRRYTAYVLVKHEAARRKSR